MPRQPSGLEHADEAERRDAGEEQAGAATAAARAAVAAAAGAAPAPGLAGGGGEVERRILGQHRLVQPPQLGARLDADLLDERRARVAVGGERLRLAAVAVQREHPLGVQVLAQRMLGDQRVELADHLGVPAGREVGVDGRLRRAQPQLVEAADLGGGERLVGDVLERVAVPQRERLARRAALQQPLEARRVHLAVGELELVAAAARDDLRAVAVQQRPQVRDVELDHLRRARRRLLAPQALDQRVGRHRAAGP